MKWLEFLPSIVWTALIVVPFWGQKHLFNQHHVAPQALGVSLIGFALLVGDWYASRQSLPRMKGLGKRFSTLALLGLLTVPVGLQVAHLSLMPHVPLIAEWKEQRRLATLPSVTHHDLEESQARLSQMREDASKRLKVSPLFVFLCQIAALLSPLLVCLLWRERHWALALAYFVFSLFYSRATLAKGPLFTNVLTYGLLIYASLSESLRKGVNRLVLVVGTVALVFAAQFLILDPLSVLNYRATGPVIPTAPPAVGELAFTLSDHNRAMDEKTYEQLLTPTPRRRFERRVNEFTYRMLLTPSEVSHRWYTYFPAKHDFLGIYGLTPASRREPGYRHPSNTVGVWAYVQRFPTHYLDSVHAYASADADAYARFGIAGLLLVALLVLTIRVVMAWLRTGSTLANSVYLTTLLILSTTLPAASLQAILVAQALIPLLLILMWFRWRETRQWDLMRVPGSAVATSL